MDNNRIASVNKADFSSYLRKAGEFYASMVDAYSRSHYTAACSCAVHCVISSIDAVCVSQLGERSKGQSHDEAIRLLSRAGPPGLPEKIRQVRDVLSLKSRVEYGSDDTSKSQAELAVKQATRVYNWAKELARG